MSREIKNLTEIRNAALQFRIEYVCGKYDIAVDAQTLACSAIPKPWLTLPFKVNPRVRPTNKTIRVFIVEAGVCVETTSLPARLTSDETRRHMLAIAACKLAPGCKREHDEKLSDWAWVRLYNQTYYSSRHSVMDADIAHEHQAELRAAVTAGSYPVLLTVGKKCWLEVIPKPSLSA